MSESSNWSRSSNASVKSHKSGKTLTEKIRDLGVSFPTKRPPRSTASLQHMEVKFQENRVTNYAVITPTLNLEQILYFQPEISYDEANPGRSVYKIGKFETVEKDSNEIKRISDIKVVSYKPVKTMKFRKKKRRSTIINKVEEILNKNKGPSLSRDPSEESITLTHRTEEREKDISDLSESILQKIFLNFTMRERNLLLSRVCKSWYYILKDPMFWEELDFHGDNVPKETIIRLITRYPSLKRLRLTSVEDAVEILQELCRCNHSVTHLGVRHCNLSNHDFTRTILHVIFCCTNLEVLDIKGMRFQSDSFFLELGRLKNLRSLNLTGNKMLRSQDLITLAVNCRKLQELKILDINLENEKGSPLRDEDFTFIIFHLQTNLKTLKVDMQQLKNASYQAVLKCSNLQCLAMKNCLFLSKEMFREFPALKNLRKLKITRAINIKAVDFQFVFGSESMSKIEDLDINGCWGVGEIGLQAITHRLSFVKSLSLKNCKSIKGQHLVHLSRCPSLTHLNIAHTQVQYNHLPTLYQHAKGLKSLVIDINMYKKATIQQLHKFFPSLKIILSYSEYQKIEKPVPD